MALAFLFGMALFSRIFEAHCCNVSWTNKLLFSQLASDVCTNMRLASLPSSNDWSKLIIATTLPGNARSSMLHDYILFSKAWVGFVLTSILFSNSSVFASILFRNSSVFASILFSNAWISLVIVFNLFRNAWITLVLAPIL